MSDTDEVENRNGSEITNHKQDQAPSGRMSKRLAQFRYIKDEVSTQARPADRASSEVHRSHVNPARSIIKRKTTDSSPSPSKRRRPSSKYAAPSRYAHLTPLTDILEPDLLCVFVGVNPGIMTATAGHAYAHPSNLFWKLLHSSGCTDRRCSPEEDRDLPRLYSFGNTNIVERPSKDQAELSKEEMIAGTPKLEQKIAEYEPEAVCIVGKGIWEAIWSYRYHRQIKKEEFRYGWQDESQNMGKSAFDDTWQGSKIFVAASTSGASASLRPPQKESIWKELGDWVKIRRAARLRQSR